MFAYFKAYTLMFKIRPTMTVYAITEQNLPLAYTQTGNVYGSSLIIEIHQIVVALNKQFEHQLLTDSLNNKKEYFGGICITLFSILILIWTKLFNLEVKKYSFFSFSTKHPKEMVIKFKKSKRLKEKGDTFALYCSFLLFYEF